MTNWFDRRTFLKGAGVALGGLALPARFARAHDGETHLSEPAVKALAQSPLVYVSPLHKDGRESTCHGEVWFTFDEESVLLATAADGWKARAVKSGRDRARLWVGNYGPVKRAGERFREAPSFDAEVRIDTDASARERLMADFAKKYTKEWGRWEPRFKRGLADGSRVLIRYTPV